MSEDEKLRISNHLLESNPVNGRIPVEPVAERPDKLEKAARPLLPDQEVFSLFSTNGKLVMKDKSRWPWRFSSQPFL